MYTVLQVKMKYFILISLLMLVNYSEQQQQKSFKELTEMWQVNMLKYHDKCLAESGADPKLALRIIPYGEYVDNHKVMCYMRCVLENLNVIHEYSAVHHENFLDILYVHDPKVLAQADIIGKCFSIKLNDSCESAYRVSECILKSIEKVLNDEVL